MKCHQRQANESGLCLSFNSLTNDKFLDWSKLKALPDIKINVTEKLKFVLGRAENITGKGENAGYQHFPIMFLKGLFLRVINRQDFVVKIKQCSKIYFFLNFDTLWKVLNTVCLVKG